MQILNSVGALAALCTTGAFIPQIIKIKRQGAEDLSFSMLFIYLAGVLLWLFYGLMLHAAAVIWANAASSFLVAVALTMKILETIRHRKDNQAHHDGSRFSPRSSAGQPQVPSLE